MYRFLKLLGERYFRVRTSVFGNALLWTRGGERGPEHVDRRSGGMQRGIRSKAQPKYGQIGALESKIRESRK